MLNPKNDKTIEDLSILEIGRSLNGLEILRFLRGPKVVRAHYKYPQEITKEDLDFLRNKNSQSERLKRAKDILNSLDRW